VKLLGEARTTIPASGRFKIQVSLSLFCNVKRGTNYIIVTIYTTIFNLHKIGEKFGSNSFTKNPILYILSWNKDWSVSHRMV